MSWTDVIFTKMHTFSETMDNSVYHFYWLHILDSSCYLITMYLHMDFTYRLDTKVSYKLMNT